MRPAVRRLILAVLLPAPWIGIIFVLALSIARTRLAFAALCLGALAASFTVTLMAIMAAGLLR
jgi:hypothetical protein